MLPTLFYTINFSISIVASSISILIGFLMIIIVIINPQCRTITNLMMCNTALATMIYSFFQIFFAGYGIREDWFSSQSACVFRAYCYTAVYVAVPASYAVQSISRLFFAVLYKYKYKYLLSWRMHSYLILINYLLSILGPIPIIFVKNGYVLEAESRLCLTTTKVFAASILSISIAYLFPLSIVTIVYSIIFYRARQSTCRVGAALASRTANGGRNSYVPNLKREMTLMKNIVILVGILVIAGMPYLTLVLWHAIQTYLPPEPFYLLALIIITSSFAIKMIVLFCMNKEIRNITIAYLRQVIPF